MLRRIGHCTFDPDLLRVRCGPRETKLTPKSADVLLALLERPAQVWLRDDLLKRVWGDRHVGDEVLTKAINELRLALGDHASGRRQYIETIPKRGYRLIAEVGEGNASPEPPSARVGAVPTSAGTASSTSRRRVKLRLAAAACALSAALALSWVLFGLHPTDSLPQSVREALDRAQPITPPLSYLIDLDVSPDGQDVVYSAVDAKDVPRLFRVPATGGEASQVTQDATMADLRPRYSASGDRLVYLHFDEHGCRVQLRNLKDDTLLDPGDCSSAFAEPIQFLDGDRALLQNRNRPDESRPSFYRRDLADGQLTPLTYPRDPTQGDVDLTLIDADHWVVRRGPFPRSTLWSIDLSNQRASALIADPTVIAGVAALPGKRDLIASMRYLGLDGLWLLSLNGDKPQYLGHAGATYPVISRTGRLVYRMSPRVFGLHEVDVAAKSAKVVHESARSEWSPALSDDGRQLAFVSDRDGANAIYRVDRLSGAVEKLAMPERVVPSGSLSFDPTGKRLLFVAYAGAASGYYEIDTDSHVVTRIDTADRPVTSARYSHDGQWLYYVASVSGSPSLWRRSTVTRTEEQIASGMSLSKVIVLTDNSALAVSIDRHRLLRIWPDGRQTVLMEDAGYWNESAWTATDAGLFYIEIPKKGDANLVFRTWEGRNTAVVPMDGEVGRLEMSVDRAGTTIVFSQPSRAPSRLFSTMVSW